MTNKKTCLTPLLFLGLTQSSGTCTAVLSQLLKVITPTGYSASSSTTTTSSTFIGQSNSAIPGTGTGLSQGQSTTSSAYASSPHVILKALKILRQLAQSGSVEFRIQLARGGKGPLSEVVGYRGAWDEIHGDRLNEDIRTIAEVHKPHHRNWSIITAICVHCS